MTKKRFLIEIEEAKTEELKKVLEDIGVELVPIQEKKEKEEKRAVRKVARNDNIILINKKFALGASELPGNEGRIRVGKGVCVLIRKNKPVKTINHKALDVNIEIRYRKEGDKVVLEADEKALSIIEIL